jgi:hypothetical protein
LLAPGTSQSPNRNIVRAIDAVIGARIEQLACTTLCRNGSMDCLVVCRSIEGDKKTNKAFDLTVALETAWEVDISTMKHAADTGSANIKVTTRVEDPPSDYTSPATKISSRAISTQSVSPRGGVWRIFSVLSHALALKKAPVKDTSDRFVSSVIVSVPPFDCLRDSTQLSSLVIASEEALSKCAVSLQRPDHPVQVVFSCRASAELWTVRVAELVCIYSGGNLPSVDGGSLYTILRALMDIKLRSVLSSRQVLR